MSDGIEAALDKLNAKNSLAAFFRAEGVKGHLNDPYSCPVASWLTRETGLDGVCVSHTVVTSRNSGDVFDVPHHVSLFIQEFDECLHPDLER